MSPERWYARLNWKIAAGFVALLAAMLVVQAVLYTWVVARSGRTVPGESPMRFAQTVAVDLAGALEQNPQLDVNSYIHEQYAQDPHPFFVMLADGRVVTSGSASFPEPLLRMAQARLQRRLLRPGGEPFDRPESERFGRGRRGGTPFVRPMPIIVGGQLKGVVMVPPSAPFGFLLGRFAPTLTIVATGVLVVGAVITSALLFGPMRQRLRELEEDARRTAASDRARRQLLADVSHELTTPVTAMRGYLETLTMPELTLDDATRARYLQIISDETMRLDRIIGDLLDLSRLEGGGGTLSHEEVPVSQLFARVAARHERASQAVNVTLETDVEPGAETIVGDRVRLEQALQNLAANAIRYAPAASTVRLTARPAGTTAVAISVEDEGPGIPPEHLPHIFDRFYKADEARTSTGSARPELAEGRATTLSSGSGLGLSIVKAIVERHGGRVSVDSRPGRTSFVITLSRQTMAT